MHTEDTIFAFATPLGGALAVLRVSGKAAPLILKRIFGGECLSSPRKICFGRIKSESGETIDECMAVFFAAPKSYTGEDMAELYLHGGTAVCQRAAAEIEATGLGRVADPGEFTRRAFLNGKMPLSHAEAVMDVINAQTGLAAKAAEEQLEGKLHARIIALEDKLRNALSGLDAAIDYPEELEEDVESGLPGILEELRKEISALIDNGERSRILREGARVVICGRPNVGKSSLLNALLNKERAIVTSLAGTTRDILEEDADFCGVPVRLYDTAGIRRGEDEAERIGVERAKAALEKADLLLVALDASAELSDEDKRLLSSTGDRERIVLLCKSDLPELLKKESLPEGAMIVSAKTGEGINELKRAVAGRLSCGESAIVTNSRHISALKRAQKALLQAEAAEDMDCKATDLREALLSLGEISGNAVDESVIENIFSSFCVGK